MQTIYIDVLLCVNMLTDYFLLYASAQLTGRRISRTRLCLASLLGAGGSCIILLPPMPTAIHTLFTAVLCLLMTLIAFGFGSISRLLRSAGALLLVTLCYGGAMTALWLFAAPRGLIINNGACYIDLSPTLLIASTVVCYAGISLLTRIVSRRNLTRSRCTLYITRGDRSVTLDAIIDTGNLLCEPFSGLPVIIVREEALTPILPEGYRSGEPFSGMRVIPYNGIGSDGIMAAFRPDSAAVEISGRRREALAYIGILRGEGIGGGCSAVVNPDALV